MDTLTVRITTNPAKISITNFPITFRKAKVSNLMYMPQSNSQVLFKISSNGQFDKNIEYATSQKWFFIQPICQNTTLGYISIEKCDDWDYVEKEEKELTNFTLSFFENDTLIPSSYLSTNPIDLQMKFK